MNTLSKFLPKVVAVVVEIVVVVGTGVVSGMTVVVSGSDFFLHAYTTVSPENKLKFIQITKHLINSKTYRRLEKIHSSN